MRRGNRLERTASTTPTVQLPAAEPTAELGSTTANVGAAATARVGTTATSIQSTTGMGTAGRLSTSTVPAAAGVGTFRSIPAASQIWRPGCSPTEEESDNRYRSCHGGNVYYTHYRRHCRSHQRVQLIVDPETAANRNTRTYTHTTTARHPHASGKGTGDNIVYRDPCHHCRRSNNESSLGCRRGKFNFY